MHSIVHGVTSKVIEKLCDPNSAFYDHTFQENCDERKNAFGTRKIIVASTQMCDFDVNIFTELIKN